MMLFSIILRAIRQASLNLSFSERFSFNVSRVFLRDCGFFVRVLLSFCSGGGL